MLIYNANVLLFSSEINSSTKRSGKDNIAKGIDLPSQRTSDKARLSMQKCGAIKVHSFFFY